MVPRAAERGNARRLRAGRADAQQLADALGGLEPRTGEHEHGGLVALDDAGGEELGEPGGGRRPRRPGAPGWVSPPGAWRRVAGRWVRPRPPAAGVGST